MQLKCRLHLWFSVIHRPMLNVNTTEMYKMTSYRNWYVVLYIFSTVVEQELLTISEHSSSPRFFIFILLCFLFVY